MRGRVGRLEQCSSLYRFINFEDQVIGARSGGAFQKWAVRQPEEERRLPE